MNIRLLLCGIVSGLVGTVALSLPLYLVLPTHYYGDWKVGFFPSPPFLVPVGSFLAVLVGAGAGYCAARWSWAVSPGDRVRSGALAGLIGGMIAFALIGGAAAGVAATAPVYAHGAVPAGTEAGLIRIVAETVVHVCWYPYLTFWALVLGAAGLGALGGGVSALQQAGSWGATPPLVAQEPVDASIAILVAVALALVGNVGPLAELATLTEESAAGHGFALGLPVRGVFDWPVGMCLLICIAATWFCGRWCTRHRGHPVAGVRRTVLIGAVLMAAVPVFALTLSAVVLVFRTWYLDAVGVLGSLAWVGVALYWIVRILRGRGEAVPAVAPPLLSFRDRLLFNAGVLGALLPALLMVTGFSQTVSLALGLLNLFPALAGEAVPGHALPTVRGSITDIYAVHFVSSFYLAAAWMILALVHASLVLAWQAFLRGRVPAAAKATASGA